MINIKTLSIVYRLIKTENFPRLETSFLALNTKIANFNHLETLYSCCFSVLYMYKKFTIDDLISCQIQLAWNR